MTFKLTPSQKHTISSSNPLDYGACPPLGHSGLVLLDILFHIRVRIASQKFAQPIRAARHWRRLGLWRILVRVAAGLLWAPSERASLIRGGRTNWLVFGVMRARVRVAIGTVHVLRWRERLFPDVAHLEALTVRGYILVRKLDEKKEPFGCHPENRRRFPVLCSA